MKNNHSSIYWDECALESMHQQEVWDVLSIQSPSATSANKQQLLHDIDLKLNQNHFHSLQ